MKGTKAKTKKDRIFIIVMAIIIANLFYILVQLVPYLIIERPANFQPYAFAVADAIGIVGALWLIREERKRRRRIGQAKEAQETDAREEA